jgi:hypothetical protein
MASPDPRAIANPPTTVWGILTSIGPGLILTANIVGTGELIATTRLGAQAGFTLLWFIVFSCFIKVFVQIELARYTLAEGVGSLDALNRLPGPRFRVSWVLWLWFFLHFTHEASKFLHRALSFEVDFRVRHRFEAAGPTLRNPLEHERPCFRGQWFEAGEPLLLLGIVRQQVT